jgi:hypothetical protein
MLQTNHSQLLEKLQVKSKAQILISLLKSPPFFIGVLILGIIVSSLFRRSHREEGPKFVPMIPVLITLVPQAKGDTLSFKLLKQIEIQQKELTSKQRLDRLTEDQIEGFHDYDLIAKKNLAPHSIVFLSDIVFKPKKLSPTKTSIQLIFPDQNTEKP